MLSKMEICENYPALLCVIGGKCVRVEVRRRPSPADLRLVTESLQGPREGLVQVYEILYGTIKCMAFCFKLGDKAIFPFTDGKDVKFKEVTEATFNENNLFQWVEAGSKVWRSLKSVAEPSMFLFFEDNKNKVTIKPVEMPHFSIERFNHTSKLKRCCIPNKLNKTTPYKKGKPRRLRRSKAKCF
ncbi:uncharacterized protein LOC143749113 isoform X2 [Siphateles boraxobius]|uniref:uncharacterized protein LOC143749113 isoform X2 n=1 Tax=Siphateles boraxobius TaxID=180520 RepID=UPI004063A42D